MPEYLSPGVYVEEVDTGNQPIEGVSTSTAGMLGVTERGPVNVHIPITSFPEFTQWFGGYLNETDYPDASVQQPYRFLPHAVEGFFTNGGQLIYVVRVLEAAIAAFAEMQLFDRNAIVGASTRLLASIDASAPTPDVYVLDPSGLAATVPPTWVQIGDGSTAEFRTVTAPVGADNDISLQLPLAFAYDDTTSAVHIDHITGFGAPVASPTLDQSVEAGGMLLHVTGAGDIVAGTLIRLGSSANGDDEYVIADAAPAVAAPTAREVILRTPVQLAHVGGGGATVDILANPLPVLPLAAAPVPPAIAPDRTTLFAPRIAKESCTLFLTNPAPYSTGDFVLVSDSSHAEIRKIGQLGSLTLAVPAYSEYPTGTIVESVTLVDDASGPVSLTADAAAGTSVIELNSRTGLNVGDVLRIGLSADPQREFIVIRELPNPQFAPNAGKVVLATPLAFAKTQASEVHRQQPPTRTAPGPTASALFTAQGDILLTVGGQTAYTPAVTIRVTTDTGDIYYHVLTGAAALDAKPVGLNASLVLPHVAGEQLVARTPLLNVRALDQGSWGNRLRIAVQDSSTPLAASKIRAIQDATHLRLGSANGIEPGTILLRFDSAGDFTSHKVINLNRQSDYLITLDTATPLPGTAAVGDVVRSQEFQLDVYLLRQPDPAVPTRGETVLINETFPQLSLDPRHSRYVHKIVGTTWTPGVTPPVDDDGNALRKSDQRSEGSSWLIRVRDLATSDAVKNSIRMGPIPLTDVSATGVALPARLPLSLGDDALGAITDNTYVGTDNIEPDLRTGIFTFRNCEDISIVACPGRTTSVVQQALIDHCESLRFRFAVLDAQPPPNDSLAEVQAQRQQFDTKYAALYHPWLLIPDPFPANLAQVADYPIPPSGSVIGVYARTDDERGVHKAPANEVVQGILGLKRLLYQGEQDILNPFPVNINVIRDFRPNNRGIRVWGGRVITSDPDWKYVNVRRLLIFIEASIERGLQWVVFEPNAEPLWAQVNRTVSNFLTSLWRDHALEGTKPEEAYFVKVDRTTMTQTDIDNGRLIVVVGVAPVKPAEFVIIRIGLWTAQAQT
jgi:phage tail sheath protein FI